MRALVLALCGALAACASTNGPFGGATGLDPVLSNYGAAGARSQAHMRAAAESSLLSAYSIRAGLGGNLPASNSSNWYLVTLAGINDINEQCEGYMNAIFRLRRDLDTARSQVGLVGTTTATLQGIFGSAAGDIAATAAGFGLITQGITNYSNNILFTIDPSGVRKLVGRSQVAYRSAVAVNAAEYYNRPAAVAALQGYLSLCLPSSIETQINESVSLTDFEFDPGAVGPTPTLRRVTTSETSGASAGIGEIGRQPVTPDPAPPPSDQPPNCVGDECLLRLSQARDIQLALCLGVEDADANLGPRTRQAIRLARAPGTFEPIGPAGETLSGLEASELIALPTCPTDMFANAFERFAYGDGSTGFTTIDPVPFNQLVVDLRAAGADIPEPAPTAFTPGLRDAVRAVQREHSLPEDGAVTPEFLIEVLELSL